MLSGIGGGTLLDTKSDDFGFLEKKKEKAITTTTKNCPVKVQSTKLC